jgi:PAS domain S-box-containing protein
VLANDVTEVRRADSARAGLLATLEASLNEIYIFDSETLRFSFVNTGACRNLGYSREELLTLTPLDLKTDYNEESFREMIAPLLRGESDRLRFDTYHRRADGSRYPVEVQLQLIERDDGRVFMAVINDLTERRRTEEQLRKNEALLHIAGRAARLGGWAVDVHAGRVSWSDEVCAIHEVPPGHRPSVAEAIGYYPPEWRSRVAAALAACAERAEPLDMETELVTAKGRRVWVRVIGEADVGAGGAVVRIQGAFQDITERKQSEDEVRRLADRLTATLESITDGFLMLDQEWRVTYLNSEAERLLHRTREDLLGRIIWDSFPEAVGGRFQQEYQRAVNERCTVIFEEFFPPLDAWFEVRAFPATDGLAIYFRDMTGRRRAEEVRHEDEARLLEQREALISLTGPSQLAGDDAMSALHRITEAAARTLGVARVSLWRFNADRSALHQVDLYETASGAHSDGAMLTREGHPAYFEAVEAEDIVAADDALSDLRTREFRDDYLRPLGITSMLDVPIRLGGRLEGRALPRAHRRSAGMDRRRKDVRHRRSPTWCR